MTVFPARRSVELKVATASSRFEILPTFVRSLPSRPAERSRIAGRRSASTTKSSVEPSVGRTSVGPTTVTNAPPARTGAARPFLDIAANHVEHQIDILADIFQCVVPEVDEFIRTEVERLLAIGGAPGADDIGAGPLAQAASRSNRPRRPHHARGHFVLPAGGRAETGSPPRGQARRWAGSRLP